MTVEGLKSATPPAWTEHVLLHFDDFLIDHAACERKASATAMMFVVRCPDKPDLVEAMIQLSREELMHFHLVWQLIRERGLQFRRDEANSYIQGLLKMERRHRDLSILDRLLIFSAVEARGCERFALVGAHHPELHVQKFYRELAEAEVRHSELFYRIAEKYFPGERVVTRYREILDAEAALISKLPIRAAVH